MPIRVSCRRKEGEVRHEKVVFEDTPLLSGDQFLNLAAAGIILISELELDGDSGVVITVEGPKDGVQVQFTDKVGTINVSVRNWERGKELIDLVPSRGEKDWRTTMDVTKGNSGATIVYSCK